MLSYNLFIKGEYYIDVFYANQLTNGSPFKSNVFDPSKIKITPNHSGVVGQVVKFEGDLVILVFFYNWPLSCFFNLKLMHHKLELVSLKLLLRMEKFHVILRIKEILNLYQLLHHENLVNTMLA
jgi:hypothetical protein